MPATPTLLDSPALDSPLLGTLTASWAKGFRTPTGTASVAQWQCSDVYPCPRPVAHAIRPTDCGIPGIVPVCAPEPCETTVGRMTAIHIGSTAGCYCDIKPSAVSDWSQVATEALTVNWAGELAAFLWDGTTLAGKVPLTHQLSFAAATPVTGGPWWVRNAVAVLVGQMRQTGYRGRVYLHAPDTLLPHIIELGAVAAGNRWVLGNIVFVLDPGYPGTDPTGTNLSWGVGTGVVGMVATGPGEWDTTLIEAANLNVHGDLCNAAATLAQRWAAARVACMPMFVAPVHEVQP
jgi:hypothetical protein